MSVFEVPPPLRWPDAVDIVLIGFLIHRLLMLFRGTATLHVTLALVLLWMLHGVTSEYNLVLTSRFLEWAGTVSVLVIVVAFRAEIREVLIQTNPMRLVLGRPVSRLKEERLNLLAEAVFHLAEQNIGALVVFQNRDRLTEHVRDGIDLGGQISVPILEAIFSKESPVHDGAVLVRGQRLERVGTILPLTRRADLPSQYGTRHRAAIGLSDVSDAVVLVASEERGEVSVVYKGQVTLVDHRSTLEEILRQHFGYAREEHRNRLLRRELFRQAAGFLLTTAAVAAYWTVFYGRELSLTTVASAIDFQNVPSGLEMTWASHKHLDIQIRGQRPLIEDLKVHPEQVSVSVSLKGIAAGVGQTVAVEPDDVQLPVGLEVFRISPNSLSIDMERRASRLVPVQPRFARALPEGARVSVSPQTVKMLGPESALSAVKSVETAPVLPPRLSPQQPEARLSVPLRVPVDSVRLADDAPRTARVLVRLAPSSFPPKEEQEPTPPGQPAPQP